MIQRERRYTVNLKKSVLKDLEKMPDIILRRVQEAILSLAFDPRPQGCKKLKG
jgi:mRNA interferase RelE/StbE